MIPDGRFLVGISLSSDSDVFYVDLVLIIIEVNVDNALSPSFDANIAFVLILTRL
jgi:hypothetical protein